MIHAALALTAFTSLFPSSAHAEDSAAELTNKPMVWLQTTSTIAPTYTNGSESGTPSTMQVAGDFGARVGAGLGQWRGEGYVLPGWSDKMNELEGGFVVGGWIRRETPRPGWGEALVVSFGGTFSYFDLTGSNQTLVTTIDVGRRLSLNGAERARVRGPEPLAQWVINFSEQVMLFDGVFIGPNMRIGIGNEDMPWDAGVGLEISAVL